MHCGNPLRSRSNCQTASILFWAFGARPHNTVCSTRLPLQFSPSFLVLLLSPHHCYHLLLRQSIAGICCPLFQLFHSKFHQFPQPLGGQEVSWERCDISSSFPFVLQQKPPGYLSYKTTAYNTGRQAASVEQRVFIEEFPGLTFSSVT